MDGLKSLAHAQFSVGHPGKADIRLSQSACDLSSGIAGNSDRHCRVLFQQNHSKWRGLC
jgi:hypothetical protein